MQRIVDYFMYFIFMDSLSFILYIPLIIYVIINNMLFYNSSNLCYFIAIKGMTEIGFRFFLHYFTK